MSSHLPSDYSPAAFSTAASSKNFRCQRRKNLFICSVTLAEKRTKRAIVSSPLSRATHLVSIRVWDFHPLRWSILCCISLNWYGTCAVYNVRSAHNQSSLMIWNKNQISYKRSVGFIIEKIWKHSGMSPFYPAHKDFILIYPWTAGLWRWGRYSLHLSIIYHFKHKCLPATTAVFFQYRMSHLIGFRSVHFSPKSLKSAFISSSLLPHALLIRTCTQDAWSWKSGSGTIDTIGLSSVFE